MKKIIIIAMTLFAIIGYGQHSCPKGYKPFTKNPSDTSDDVLIKRLLSLSAQLKLFIFERPEIINDIALDEFLPLALDSASFITAFNIPGIDYSALVDVDGLFVFLANNNKLNSVRSKDKNAAWRLSSKPLPVTVTPTKEFNTTDFNRIITILGKDHEDLQELIKRKTIREINQELTNIAKKFVYFRTSRHTFLHGIVMRISELKHNDNESPFSLCVKL